MRVFSWTESSPDILAVAETEQLLPRRTQRPTERLLAVVLDPATLILDDRSDREQTLTEDPSLLNEAAESELPMLTAKAQLTEPFGPILNPAETESEEPRRAKDLLDTALPQTVAPDALRVP